MGNTYYVVWLAVLVTLLVYFLVSRSGPSGRESLNAFLFANKKLTPSEYSRTFVATGISLATVLAFFLEFSTFFGMALIMSPLMYLVGVYLFGLSLKSLEQDGFLSKGTTMHSFLGEMYASKKIRVATAVISILGYVGILIIELHVGSQIFKLILPDTIDITWVAIVLAMIVTTYVYQSGFGAVVRTDKIQLVLILIGSLLALMVVLDASFSSEKSLNLHLFLPEFWKLPLAMIVVLIVGNIPLQILRMSNWQRAAAVGNASRVWKGLKSAMVWTLAFWALFNVIGVLLSNVSNDGPAVFGGLRLLNVIEGAQNTLSLVTLPIVFIALLAALLSTADSIMVPILTSLTYDFKYPELSSELWKSGVKISGFDEGGAVRFAQRATIGIGVMTVVCYLILVKGIGFDFISLLFGFFNQQLVLFPAVIIALDPEKDKLGSVAFIVLLATTIGWISVWCVTLIGVYSGSQNLVFLASVVGIGVAISISLFQGRCRIAYVRSFRRIFRST